MADGERLGASFSIDITALKTGLAQANRLIKESNSEFKAAAAGLDDWTKSEEGLTAKLKNLNDVADIQAKKVDALQKEYDDCIAKGVDPMSGAMVKLRTDINNAKADLAGTQSEIKKYSDKLEDLGDASDDAGEELEDLGDAAKDTEGGFTIAKGAIADLISSGIQKLAGACKDAISSIAGLADETRESRTAFAKLEQSFSTAGLGAEAAQKTMSDLYGVLGDTDKANEASMLISKMSKNQQDLEKNTRILTGVYAEYGDSIPTEGLAEAMSATAAMGNVQGVLADALEWQGVNLDEYNEKLASMATEEERAAYIQETLTDIYGESADSYRENNKALIEANEAQLEYEKSMNKFGDIVEPITTKVKEGFNKILQKALELVEGVDFDKLGETIDKAFDTFINDVLPKVIDGFEWIKKNGKTIAAVLAGIGAGFAAFKVASLITSVTSALKGMSIAQAALNAVMSANPIGLIAIAIAGLVTGIVLLIQNWDAVKEAAVKCWDKIKEVWEKVAQWFEDSVVKPIKDFFSGLWDGIKKTASAAWDGVKKTWTSVSGWFKDSVSEPIKKNWDASWDATKKVASAAWDKIKAVWSVVSEWFKSSIIDPIKKNFTDTWDAIKNLASSAWDGIKNVWNAVSGWFKDSVAEPVKKSMSETWDKLKSGASDAWSGIKNVFSSVGSFFKDTFTNAWESVKNVFSTGGKIFDGIKDGIVSSFKTIVNGIIGGINKVVATPFNAINNALNTIRNIEIAGFTPFSGLLPSISVPQIPLLAKGGVVRQATTAVIGEDGAEAVVPLEKNTEWIDKVADKLASKQKTVVVNQTNNYSQAHSRYELYKSKQQTAAAVRLALQGG